MKKLKKSVIIGTTASIACILANGCAFGGNPEDEPCVYGPPIDYEESIDEDLDNSDYDLDQSEDDKESDDEDEIDEESDEELDDVDEEEIDGEIDLEVHEALYGPAPSIFDRIF